MKYNLKTAIRIVREEDRQELIPFFEAIKSDCNKLGYNVRCFSIDDIWFIAHDGTLVCTESVHHKLNNHTILNGVPQGWREEMTTEERMADKMLEMSREGIDLQSKIDKLESENKEFRECLSEIYKELELWVEGKKQFTSNSKALITQAKQLLNK